jgi:hypothetical protein
MDFDFVVRSLDDPDSGVRTEAREQARQIMDRESPEVVADLVKSVTDALRTMGADGLVEALRLFQGRLTHFPPTVAAVVRLLTDRRNEPQVIRFAALALGSAIDHPDAIEALIHEVRDVASPARVEAMNALQPVAHLPQVIAVARNLGPEPPADLKRAAIRVLGSPQALEGQATRSQNDRIDRTQVQPGAGAPGRSEEIDRVNSAVSQGESTPLIRDAVRRQIAIDAVQDALGHLREMETTGIERQLVDALVIADLEFVIETLMGEVTVLDEFLDLSGQVRAVRTRLERLQFGLTRAGEMVLGGIVGQVAIELAKASPFF